jgi:uncharacterized protein
LTDPAESVTRGTAAEAHGATAPPSIGVPSIPIRHDDSRPSSVPSLPAPGTAPPEQLAGGFAPGVAEKLRSYVYLFVDPRSGRTFFVGRGRDDRCFQELAAVRRGGETDPAIGGTGTSVGKTVDDIEAAGATVRVDILCHGLDQAGAATVEAAVAEALDIPSGSKLARRRRTLAETNAALAKPVRFKRTHQVVVRRFGAADRGLYDTVRHGWDIDPRWTDLDSPRSPQWAVIACGGLVSSVYRVERWESGAENEGFSFVGRRDPVLQARYAGRSVSSCPPESAERDGGDGGDRPGDTGALIYVGCGPNWVEPSA